MKRTTVKATVTSNEDGSKTVGFETAPITIAKDAECAFEDGKEYSAELSVLEEVKEEAEAEAPVVVEAPIEAATETPAAEEAAQSTPAAE